MVNIAIIVGSTRPNRKSEAVAQWIHGIASRRSDASFELVDLAQHELPLLDEPRPPSLGQYEHEHTKTWAAKVAAFDGYVFVTPEYNHGPSAVLKNAIDFLYAEWNNKAAGFVSYGSAGGVRAVEQLRLVMAELQIADVRAQVTLSTATDFEKSALSPDPRKVKNLETMLDQVVAWAGALRAVRAAAMRAAAAE
jgi:NAD(P)H-dependent FMN reductase